MNKPRFKHDSSHYLTAVEKKHLPLAYEYCKKNGMTECKVNQKVFTFDFVSQTGFIQTIEGGWKYDGKTPFFWN